MNVVKTICLRNNWLTLIRENTDFPWLKPRRISKAAILKNFLTFILHFHSFEEIRNILITIRVLFSSRKFLYRPELILTLDSSPFVTVI